MSQKVIRIGADDVVHECDGTFLDDGTPCVWTLCGEQKTVSQPRVGLAVTCSKCLHLTIAARIIQSRVCGWGPPDLVSSSLPRSM